jgi:hypothetical protein
MSTAVHEAGHIVVAYALGRRVTLVRIGRQTVPADHPHAELLQGSVTGGESRFGPALGPEISHRIETGAPLATNHIEWLCSELVTCFAGFHAELRLLGEMDQDGALADVAQASIVVRFLGITGDVDGGATRVERAEQIAQTVLAELSACVERVAAALSEGPCEFNESSAHALLEQSGVQPGSHRKLLDELGP